jgi:glutathione S-transferase
MVPWIFGDEFESLAIETKYPNFTAWFERLMSRPAVKQTIQAHADAKGHH